MIDLNSDVGEGFGSYKFGTDGLLIKEVTSVNIACGFHAGDPVIMRKTVEIAVKYSKSIGAHPAFPDLMGFGRREMKLSEEEIRDYVLYQIGALNAFVKAAKGKLTHVKAHGALYNMAAKDDWMARAIARAVFDFDHDLILVGLSGSKQIEEAKAIGLKVANEAFADRNYNGDGTLVSREYGNSVIKDVDVIVKRAISMVKDGTVKSIDGKIIELKVDTICVHSDTPDAVQIARKLREGFEGAGVEVRGL